MAIRRKIELVNKLQSLDVFVFEEQKPNANKNNIFV